MTKPGTFSITTALAEFVYNMRVEDLPAHVIRVLGRVLFDTISVIMVKLSEGFFTVMKEF